MKRPDGKRKYLSAALVDQMSSGQQLSTNKKKKNRRREAFVGVLRSEQVDTPMAMKAQQVLARFCKRFVKDCYGPLMKSIKNEFRRDSVRLEEGDEVVFFRIVWFFSRWSRTALKTGTVGSLIFTMDVFTFNLVLTAMDKYSLHKQYPRLTQAVALYREMLHLLHKLQLSKDSTENLMALGLMDRIFFGSEPLDRLPRLLSKWEPSTTTREHLCDLTDSVHMTMKLLENVSSSSAAAMDASGKTNDDHQYSHSRHQKKNNQTDHQQNDSVERMRASAAAFDPSNYFLRKFVSNPSVFLYTHLLSQYRSNSVQENHRVMAYMLRLSKVQIGFQNETDDGEYDEDRIQHGLSVQNATLQPMLFHVQLFTVLQQILCDLSIQNDKQYSVLLLFAAKLMRAFANTAKDNPMLFVEALFRHPAPHRFCELTTNMYVNEELRMIAEREVLMEEQQRLVEEEEAAEIEAAAKQQETEDEVEVEDSVVEVGGGQDTDPGVETVSSDDKEGVDTEEKSGVGEDGGKGVAEDKDGNEADNDDDNDDDDEVQVQMRRRTRMNAIIDDDDDSSDEEEMEF